MVFAIVGAPPRRHPGPNSENRMRVMVTGATGYVSAHSVKALLDAGHRVRLLVRDPDKAQAVLGAPGVKGGSTASAAT